MMDLVQQPETPVDYQTGVTTALKFPNTEAEESVFPSQTPQPTALILQGLCVTCDRIGDCVWQHNNKINCQHYQ